MADNTTNFDVERAEAFGGKLIDALNGGSMVLMVSIGHRTGLFDAMNELPPSTSDAIATKAGLDERYVREWLGAMVTSGVVDYDASERTYQLPAEHAASLTRAARPANMAATCQWLAVMAGVESPIVECFEKGGGVPYSAYERFHEVMADESDQTVVAVLIDLILPAAPGIVEALESGIDVLDVGCGSGRAINLMASHFPKSRFHGWDLSQQAIEVARAQAKAEGLENASFEVKDLAATGIEAEFDLITAFDAIHDQAAPDVVLAAISRALRPGGTFLMQEIGGSSHVEKDVDHPIGTFLYTISCTHCMTVSLSADGMGLGAMWGEAVARNMLAEAGFEEVTVRDLPHDVINKYFVARK